MKRTITLFTILLLCAVSLFAQAPEKFSYQAVVRNTSNALITDAQVGVRVSILQGSAEGNAVYVETHAASTNANGLLTVEIGGGKAEQGSFADIDWANGPYFLKTETDPNGGSDYGVTIIQQLLSVPYALYAREAANSFSGDYNDLTNKPAIPQNVGELTNDAGYITLSDLPPSSKGGNETDNAGVVQTQACGEIDLCELMDQLAQQQAQLAQQQSQLEELQEALLPTVTTNEVTNVKETTAYCGGKVADEGCCVVTSRGVCWNTEPNPTVENFHTSNGSGTGNFTSNLTELVANTTYYVRAYATNSAGTAYGEEKSFTAYATVVDAQSCPKAPRVTDGDGNVYNTVLIGEQCWMRQNLRTTKRADGATIDGGGSNTSDTAPYYYDYSSSSIPLEVRGYLYNWPAAMVACPAGWHLPSDAEWKQLTDYIKGQSEFVCDGGTDNIAKALASTSRWNSTSTACAVGNGQEANNAAGFSALPAGRCNGSSFRSDGLVAHYWSSTEGSSGVYERYLHYNSANVSRSNLGKDEGFSVRCIWDGSPIVDEKSCPGVSTAKDYDGNTYSTVQIGEQCWMRQNLRTTKRAQYSSIPAGGSNTSSTAPYYYDYSNSNIPLEERGYLYNWTAAKTACPTGWHLPSDEDWMQLENYVKSQGNYVCSNNTNYIAKALASTSRWNSTSTTCAVGNGQETNNATGFSAIPAGRCEGSSFRSAGLVAHYWSSTESGSGVYEHYLHYKSADVTKSNSDKFNGFSVRCIHDELPTVTTGEVSHVGMFSAKCGGIVTLSGSTTVTTCGVCWSTSQNPTATDNHTSESSLNFNSNITGLTPSTTYYVRAYATTGAGTTYGEERSFTTLSHTSGDALPGDAQPCLGTPTVKDVDGNTYGTVKIGEQCWMRQNMRAKHYPSGTSLWYYDDSDSDIPLADRGYLYSWGVAKNICPTGWHLPSKADWKQLTDYVGSVSQYHCGNNSKIAKALASPSWWNSSNVACHPGNQIVPNNATGFGAVPAGYYADYITCDKYWRPSDYFDAGNGTIFWTATHDSIYVNYGDDGEDLYVWENIGPIVFKIYSDTYFATYYYDNSCYYTDEYYSVRCLRDSISTSGETPNTPPAVDEKSCSGTATLTDIDGNTYRTVQIGDQCWMRENLRVTRYADGTSIPVGGSSSSASVPYSYACWSFGVLEYFYNWPAAMHGAASSNANPSGVQGICPTGWHLPSDAEWTQLTDFVKNQSEYVCGDDADNIAKALASSWGWYTSTSNCAVGKNQSTNNATGFGAAPVGYWSDGFVKAGSNADFWSSTLNERLNRSYFRYLTYSYADVNRSNRYNDYGFSIRCIRD